MTPQKVRRLRSPLRGGGLAVGARYRLNPNEPLAPIVIRGVRQRLNHDAIVEDIHEPPDGAVGGVGVAIDNNLSKEVRVSNHVFDASPSPVALERQSCSRVYDCHGELSSRSA